MKKIIFKILFFVLINLTFLSCKSQSINNEKFDYYKIDLKSEETAYSKLMRIKSKKEFYTNKQLTIYKNQTDGFLELIYFYKNGRTEKHLFKNNEHFFVKNFKYVDENLGELSDSEKEQIKKMFEIKADDIKQINGNDCFKIVLKGGSQPIEMYVSKDIPSLPNNLVPSNVFNGECLETKMSIFSENIEFGVTEFIKNINIEEHLGVSFNNPKGITESEYIKLTE